jgi:phosphoserine aminotransferase
MEKLNNAKASLLYHTIDSLPLFKGVVAKEDRSQMNVVFVIEDPAIEKEFFQLCTLEGMVGIRGHRTAGGFRASLYNALKLESVEALTDLMKEFANKKG